jgi:hypothetical protein
MAGAIDCGDTGPQTPRVCEALLRRSMGPPTLENARLRYAVATSMALHLSPPLSADAAGRLAGSMIEWLAAMRTEWLRPGSREGCGAPPGSTIPCETAYAITASRDLLERASVNGAPLARFRAAIAADSSPRTCVPSEEDQARAAALAHEIETDVRPEFFVSAPGAGCVQVATIAGLVTANTSTRPSQRKMLRVDEPRLPNADEGLKRGEAAWDEAPARVVQVGLYEGGGEYWSRELVVKKVGGLWRVIGEIYRGED